MYPRGSNGINILESLTPINTVCGDVRRGHEPAIPATRRHGQETNSPVSYGISAYHSSQELRTALVKLVKPLSGCTDWSNWCNLSLDALTGQAVRHYGRTGFLPLFSLVTEFQQSLPGGNRWPHSHPCPFV